MAQIFRKIKKIDKDNYKIIEVDEKSGGFEIKEFSIVKSQLETEIAWFEDQLVEKKALLKDLK